MTPKQLELLKEIYELLVPSNTVTLAYIPPAQAMRNAADKMERKDSLINQLGKEIYFWEKGEYPKEPEVTHIDSLLVGNTGTTIGTTKLEN